MKHAFVDMLSVFEREPGCKPGTSRALVEDVFDRLVDMQLQSEIAPGDRLSIDELARTFKVSPTPVREALSRLEAMGMVVHTRNAGYTVADRLARSQLEHLYEFRLLVEPHAARLAALRMTEAQRARLVAIQAEDDASGDGAALDRGRFSARDLELHRIVAAGSGNALVGNVIGRLHAHFHLFKWLLDSHDTAEACAEHMRIIAALLCRDAEGSEVAMREHLERGRERMLITIENGN